MGKFTNRSGKIRFYDSTATPIYLEIDFDAADFNGPIGVPLPDEIVVLDRGKADANMHHIEGSEQKVWDPSTITFGALVTDLSITDYLLDWIEWLNGGSATVNSHALATTKGDTARDGVVSCPAFADSDKRACNVEVFYDGSGTDQGWKYGEVFFPADQCQLSEGEDAVTVALSGLCYGAIERITAFTAGTSVES